MAATVESPQTFDLSDAAELSRDMAIPRRRFRWLGRLAMLAVTVAAVAGGAYWFKPQQWFVAADSVAKVPTQKVTRDDLVITVTEDGTVESSSNVEVRCEVAGGSTILWIIKDGTQVTADEELVRLDSSAIEDQISQQKIAWEKAKAAVIEAEKTLSAAKISLQEYVEGTFVKELQLADANIVIAMENLRSAQNQLLHTQRMARKGYVTSLQRDAQLFAVQRAKLELQAQETAKMVLEKFSKQKMVEDLESARDTAEALSNSNKAAFELEDGRLKRLDTQLAKCIIKAPASGMVVYANESQPGRFGNQQGPQIEEGATVRERQTIIRLPDLARMQVRMNVHESKIQSLRTGMKAYIRWQDQDLKGTIAAIANQAEPFNFFAPNSKEYSTTVRIEGTVPPDLRPGMTAIVEVLVANLKDVLTVPPNAIVETPTGSYCWVQTVRGPEKREVQLGAAGNTAVEVKEGLKEDDLVLINPRAAVADAQQAANQLETIDVNKRFGESVAIAPPVNSASPGPPNGPRANGGQGGERRRFDPMQFDKNGDRKLSQDEVPEQMKPFFATADENKDGFIDLKEITAMRKKVQSPGGGSPP